MRRVLIALLLIVSLPALSAHATSWAYPFVVFNDSVYVTTDEPVEAVGEKLGEVTKYSDMEQFGGNFSNEYPVGTHYYTIEGVDSSQAIAVQTDNGYIRANYESSYDYNPTIIEKITSITDPIEEPIAVIGNSYFKWIVIGVVILVLVLVVLAKRGDRRK